MFQNFFNKKEDKSKQNKKDSTEAISNELSVDERFVVNYINKGGKFLYCSSMGDAIDGYQRILKDNDWNNGQGICYAQNLISGLSELNIHLTNNTEKARFLITHCESLISDTGAILLCSRQINEKKIVDLPQNFILFASVSQIVSTLSEGLKLINNHGVIPTNITTVENFSAGKEVQSFLGYSIGTSKNIYLLLVEDF